MANPVYKNPKPGQPLISTISTGCQTPLLEVKFCNLANPYRYPNSPTIPRYSVTCVVDPEIHKEFLKGVQSIEKQESVESIIKNETTKDGHDHINTGKVLLKFQGKDKIPIYLYQGDIKTESPLIDLEDELGKDEKIIVIYDILRYTKKNSMKTEHGLNFKPTKIFLLPRV